ncbi:MAG: histidine kinase N-terminal domain-containing protein [Synergistes jonesii]|uniref:sensor histidine kinase n=1 Tax=Synergistes jonesii TaxID=2754 RepID=UPI002A74D158|nr:histidine kinase N-terminal domain-containing protein [Synergistes jonesii]MDY2984584.1 histidine kinase N-terminal domain-containing protein [Synergistes jonesii]
MSVVKDLCQQYTDLTDEDIATIEGMSAILKPLANLEDADIFIDCPLWSEDAIVVAEAKPDYVPSSYKKSVVGLLAKKHNEPAVARTFRLGVATKQMKAITQENTHVIQTVEPIRNGAGRVIGVLIREKRADEERVQSERIHFSQQSYKRIAKAIAHMTADDSSWLAECIDEALIIVDRDGYVSYCNSLARELYKRLGYVYDILGQSYQNILQIYFPEPRGVDDVAGFSEVEVELAHSFLAIRRIDLDSKGMGFALIIRDITDKKEREKELILKSVAIQEMHHRVKNNLQTIASLLRLQCRRARDMETQKVLQESMSRILSIAVTHELLSQVGIDSVNIREVILNIKNNTLRYFSNIYTDNIVEVQVEGDDFQVDADTSTSIALVVNELLQNSLEHAFLGKRQKGIVRISITHGSLYSSITVEDNGRGFNMKKAPGNTLGLSIVNALVKDKLDGSFSIVSTSRGTCATFEFKNFSIEGNS